MKWYVTDTETSIKNRGDGAVGDSKANPFHRDNKIVLLGERHGKKSTLRKGSEPDYLHVAARGECVLLVGQNICFDLKYIAKTWPVLWQRALPAIYIWDTQQVAYLISGQTHMYPSLDELSAQYGLPLKDDRLKEYWDAGIDTEMIEPEILEPYLHHDLETTEAVFREQYKAVSNNDKLMALVKIKMDDLLCTNEMEINGMEFDLGIANSFYWANQDLVESHTLSASHLAKPYFHGDFEFNPMSNDHVSLVMFGGTYKRREAVPVMDGAIIVRYKTGARKGEVKTKLTDVEYFTKGMGLTPPKGLEAKKGIYSVADEVLKKFDGVPFVYNIQRLRELTKENETYYKGYSELVWPDNKIHGQIGHCGTRTGRNNHSKPNLGNVTRE